MTAAQAAATGPLSEPEVRKPVLGYEELYEISNHGRAWNLRTGRLLKPSPNSNGYLQIALRRGGVTKHRSLAAVMLETFEGPAPDGHVARPKNGKRADVRLTNYAWRMRTGRSAQDRGVDSDVAIDQFSGGPRSRRLNHPVSGSSVTRVEYRGWAIDVSPVSMWLPQQVVTNDKSLGDLQTCLDAARALMSRDKRVGELEGIVDFDEPDTSVRDMLLVLRAARRIAEESWHPLGCDIYTCTQRAWEYCDYAGAYAGVINALRSALPAPQSLTEFSAEASRSTVCGLFDRAIDAAVEAVSTVTRGAA